MARYLYSELASVVHARLNCIHDMDRLNPNEVSASVAMSDNQWHQKRDWRDRHEDRIKHLVKELMPSGGGFDSGTSIDLERSHAEKLVFTTSYHHMNENGFYCG